MKSTTLLFTVLASIYTTFAFSQAGTLDSSFNKDGIINKPEGRAYAVAVQPDGKIIAGGSSFTLVRYTTAGYIDKSFGVNGIATAFSSSDAIVSSFVIKPSGKIIAAGTDGKNFAIAKFNADGTLDSSFGNKGTVSTNFLGAFDEAYSVAVQPDNKIVAAGLATDPQGSDLSRIAVARYNPDGSLDSSFNYDGKVSKHAPGNGFDGCQSIILQPGGKIVCVGNSYPFSTRYDFTLVRFKSNGEIDSSFGTDGFTISDFFVDWDLAAAAAVQSDGKIVVAGQTYSLTGDYKLILARYTKNGKLDSSFGTNGSVITNFNTSFAIGNGIAIQDDDKILIAANVDDFNFAVARFTKNGKIDNSFNNNGYVAVDLGSNQFAYALTIQANGKIVAAGTANGNFVVARFNNNAQSENLIADNTSLLSADNLTSKIKLFPNPVKDVLHITGIKSQATISILNAAGKLVKQSTANQTSEINIKQLPSGIYYLHVEENVSPGKDKKISNVKFMKQ